MKATGHTLALYLATSSIKVFHLILSLSLFARSSCRTKRTCQTSTEKFKTAEHTAPLSSAGFCVLYRSTSAWSCSTCFSFWTRRWTKPWKFCWCTSSISGLDYRRKEHSAPQDQAFYHDLHLGSKFRVEVPSERWFQQVVVPTRCVALSAMIATSASRDIRCFRLTSSLSCSTLERKASSSSSTLESLPGRVSILSSCPVMCSTEAAKRFKNTRQLSSLAQEKLLKIQGKQGN